MSERVPTPYNASFKHPKLLYYDFEGMQEEKLPNKEEDDVEMEDANAFDADAFSKAMKRRFDARKRALQA